MSFRRRNYPEVLDNLLTTLVGGVAAETHPFPPTEDGPLEHPLEQPPVRQIVSVYGIRNGQQKLFRVGSDYELKPDKQTLAWVSADVVPDNGTLIYVNYLREDVIPTLTDLQVGSVARTMTESVALEIARLYAQLEAVYKAGFIDTATGSSLDKVVSLLDVRRFLGTRPSAKIRFNRAEGAKGVITLPAGIRLLDEQTRFEYETTESVTMTENQNSVTVIARDLEPGNEPVPADTLTILAVPIAGIASVTNPAPASRAAADETDTELRTRAKNFLHGSERATIGAMRQVLVENGIEGDIDDETTVGHIVVTPHADNLTPEQIARLDAELDATRPAGVVVDLKAPLAPLRVDLKVRLKTTPKTVEADLRAAHNQVREAIASYFDRLETRASASINQIVGTALAIDHVEDIQIEQATTTSGGTTTDRLDIPAGVIDLAGQPTLLGELTLADSNLPTTLDLVIDFPTSAEVPNQTEIEDAMSLMVAYLNGLSEMTFDPADPVELQKRTLSFGKLLHVVPLPGHSSATLADYDLAPDPTTLPDAASRAPYTVSAFINQTSGITRILADDAAGYLLTASERLRVDSITIAETTG
jgi:uncharacterized phage protein gp47/JayE